MELKDAHVYLAASKLLGDFGAKIILIFVIISVMGTVNGLVLGFIRLPYSLALRDGMFPLSNKLKVVNEKFNMPVNSSVLCYILTIIWTVVHYLTTKQNLLANSDISEISIVMSYMFYILLYYNVFKLFRKGVIKSIWKGIIVPIMATIGSLFILSSGIQNTLFFYYVGFCILTTCIAMFYYKRNSNS
jgi:APA family basic amino acid/polyamine antiporter